jgi:hypothetical protein
MNIRIVLLLAPVFIVCPLLILGSLYYFLNPDKAIQHVKSWYKSSNRNAPGIQNDPEKLQLLLENFEKSKWGKIYFSKNFQIIAAVIGFIGGIVVFIGMLWLYKTGQL